MNNNYQYLRDKWVKRHQDVQKRMAQSHKKAFEKLSSNTKQLAVGTMGSLMLLATPMQKPPTQDVQVAKETPVVDKKVFLLTDLASLLPQEVRPLTEEEETKIGEILTDAFGVKSSAVLDEKRLNRSYGYIGAEQHLARFPGDTMSSHFDGNMEDAAKYYSSGMAPGLGAWGYFTTSRSQMTEEDVMREKYYIAVQTFLAPDFNSRVAEYRDFFKYRKMLVVNPHNGKAVVAVIGDAGPAEWTGKHLGGSPEVMKYLERVDGRQKGPVLYYFIDDPDNQIPLGPIQPTQ